MVIRLHNLHRKPVQMAKGPVTLGVQKQIKIRLNGVEKQVTAIEKAGHNYVMLQDLRDSRIDIGYDSKADVPVVEVK